MRGPLISVVMPCHNACKTIGVAIFSVINQKYADLELIIVDDGSTDRTKEEIGLFSDERIRLISLQENAGIATALNVGLSDSKGRFIARMDADDVMEACRLGDQFFHMRLHGLAILGSAAEKFGAETGTMHAPESAKSIMDSMLVSNPFIHPTVMFDREAIGVELKYDAGFSCEEDYELWSRVVTDSNCENISYSTLKYRTAANSNANHPHKKRLKIRALRSFAARMGIESLAPIAELSEFQLSGFISAPNYARLVEYAHLAQQRDLPLLGWLQSSLIKRKNYADFLGWLNKSNRFLNYSF